MNRGGRAALILCIAGIMTRLLWSGGFGWFVQQRMQIPLLLATVVLIVFGLSETIIGFSSDDPEEDHRSVGPRVGWLLALPVIVLISVAPTALGAAAAGRVDSFNPTQTDDLYSQLDDSDGPVEMRVLDFVNRALWDESETLDGVTVKLEGLVVNDPDVPDGFRLTRFVVSCCAADGLPVQVILHNTGPPLEDDTWVSVDVVWRKPDVPYNEQETAATVEADAVTVTIVPDPPTDPYESPY